MKNALILHGRPSKTEYYSNKYPSMSNSHWLPWLQKQLLNKDIHAHTPEIYKSYKPTYEKWAKEIDRYDVTAGTILVGHSCGGGMILQWLSKNKDKKVGKVVLVAPWIDVEKDDWPAFDFELDINLVSRTSGLTIFHSDNDDPEMQSTMKLLKEKLENFKYKEFHNYGHFTHKNLPDDKFPELLEECLN